MEDLLGTLDDPALPLLQWTDALSAVAARLATDLADHLQARTHLTGCEQADGWPSSTLTACLVNKKC